MDMNTDHNKKSERLSLVLTPEQRRAIETLRLQLEQRGRRASLNAVAIALIERGLSRQDAA